MEAKQRKYALLIWAGALFLKNLFYDLGSNPFANVVLLPFADNVVAFLNFSQFCKQAEEVELACNAKAT